MRRLAGAWWFFLLVMLVKCGTSPRRHLEWPARPAWIGTTAPQPTGGEKTSRLPPYYASDPLLYFSRAPRDSLILLPGIGPVLADRIICARGGKRLFRTWDDLLTVKGIGNKKIEEFKRLAGNN